MNSGPSRSPSDTVRPPAPHDGDRLRLRPSCATAGGRRRAAAGRAGGSCPGRGRCRRRPRCRMARSARTASSRNGTATDGFVPSVTSFAPIMITASSGRVPSSAIELGRQVRGLGADDGDVGDVDGPAGRLGDADGELRGRGVAVAVDAVAGGGGVAEQRDPDRRPGAAHPGGGPGRVVRRRAAASVATRDAPLGELHLAATSTARPSGRRRRTATGPPDSARSP